MACFPTPHPAIRAPRFFVAEDIPVAISLEKGKGIVGRLKVLSSTGGRAAFNATVASGSFVEVSIRARMGEVVVLAEMLKASASGGKWQQPFRFVALSEEDHEGLRRILSALRA